MPKPRNVFGLRTPVEPAPPVPPDPITPAHRPEREILDEIKRTRAQDLPPLLDELRRARGED